MSIQNHNRKHAGSRNRMMVVSLAVLLSMAALLALVVKLNNNGNTQSASAATGATATSSEAPAAPTSEAATAPEEVKLVIKSDEEHGKKGPEGTWHDAYLPASFSVKAGATVKVTVYNYDDSAHTFTSPGLGVNVDIAAGGESTPSKTTFTFQAPQKAATYQSAATYEWYCAMPCDPFAMTHLGFMRGDVTVI